jgi:hypothetical protein
MCPACVATIALIAAGAASVGGFGVEIAKTLRMKADDADIDAAIQSHGDQNDSSENRVAI